MKVPLVGYKRRLSLRQLFAYYKVSMTISIMSILFGMSLFTVNTAVRVLETPLREAIGVYMIVAGVGKLVALILHKPRARGLFLLALAVGWALITYIYFVSDVLSRDWILTGGCTAHCLISLQRGNFEPNE